MTLEGYVKKLQEILDKHPESATMDVIYARDDEGNGFSDSVMEPSFCQYEDGEACFGEGEQDFSPNAVCIN